MIVKINRAHGREVVAICDEEILGKKFEQDDRQLDLSSSFYQGKKAEDSQVEEIMKVSDDLNLVGEKTISMAKRLGVIDDDNVRRIADIPYAQVTGATQ